MHIFKTCLAGKARPIIGLVHQTNVDVGDICFFRCTFKILDKTPNLHFMNYQKPASAKKKTTTTT